MIIKDEKKGYKFDNNYVFCLFIFIKILDLSRFLFEDDGKLKMYYERFFDFIERYFDFIERFFDFIVKNWN